MAFHVRDKETDTLVRELARVKGVGLTEAVKVAAEAELKREREKLPLRERIRPIQDKIASWGKTGLIADKAFFDDMWGQGDD